MARQAQYTEPRILKLLHAVPLFQGLAHEDLIHIAALVAGQQAEAGQIIFSEGEAGDQFYVVYEGAVEVLKERRRGEPERLAIRRAGEAFGEMALLADTPRSATVRALQKTRLLAIRRQDFIPLLGGDGLAVRLLQSLSRALRALDVRFAAREQGGGDLLREFSRLLRQGLLPRQALAPAGFTVAGVVAGTGRGDTLWDTAPSSGGATLAGLVTVRGEGLPPAHALGVARALVRALGREAPALDGLLDRVNVGLQDGLPSGHGQSVDVLLVRLTERGAEVAAGGAQVAVMLRAGGGTETLAARGPSLGVLPAASFATAPLELAEGEALLLLSEPDAGLAQQVAAAVRTAGNLTDRARRLDEEVEAAALGTGREISALLVDRR
jgi:CRP-like cAMP-binding protein